MINVNTRVRTALPQDQHQIANLMFFESHVHRHLDWRAPLEWLGSPNYWVVENDTRDILATLACPQDPPGVAWVRLFAHARRIPLDEAWGELWEVAKSELAKEDNNTTIALIVMHQWLREILGKSGFQHTLDVVMLERKELELPSNTIPDSLKIRKMTLEDLPEVAALDAAAFTPLWQNPLNALEKALPQAISAVVAEDADGLVGYQISTQNPLGAHLARLAVRPDAQKQGIGTMIVADLIRRLNLKNIARLTVNTQSDNITSLALYKKMGFVVTGEKFPVYCYSINQ